MERVDYQSLIVQDLINLHKQDELDLSPWYQRREVWSRPQKSYLINTIFVRKPIPTVYIRHKLDLQKEKSIKEIVDGQQRVRAVLEYVAGDYAARHPGVDKPIRYADLKGKRRESFLLAPLSVGYLQGASDADVIEIFGRLNSVSKSLNAAEKRNARYGGEFKQFALEEAAGRVRIWRDAKIFTSAQISRMAEVEFVAQLAMNMENGLQDYASRKIDKYYEANDERYASREQVERRMENVFAQLIDVGLDQITNTIFRRPPLFFSLFIALDSRNRMPSSQKIKNLIWDIDEAYRLADSGNSNDRDLDKFYLACKQNPHRIKNRETRHNYVVSYL